MMYPCRVLDRVADIKSNLGFLEPDSLKASGELYGEIVVMWTEVRDAFRDEVISTLIR